MTATTATALTKLFAYRRGRLANSSLYSLAGLSLRTGAQVALLVLLARAFGVGGFGAFTTVVAISTLLAPLACLGTPTPLVRDVAQDPRTYPARLATALVAWLCAAPVVTLGATVLATLLPLQISWQTVAAIVAAEVLFAPLVNLAAQSFQAHERAGAMAAIMSGLIVFRLAVGLGLLGAGVLTLDTYAWGQLAATALYAGAVIAGVVRRYGMPAWHAASLSHALQTGRAFMAIDVAQRVQAEVNKPILLSLAGAPAAGVFAAAHRAIDAATLPFTAFVTAAAPRIYRAAGAPRAVLALLPVPLLGAAGLGVAVWFAASLLPWLLGPSYEAAVAPTRMLCALPLFSLLRMLSVTALVASGRQQVLMFISFLAGGASALLTMGLVPLLGPAGAVYSLYLVEGLVILAALFVFRSQWQA